MARSATGCRWEPASWGTPRVGFSTSEYGQDYRVGYGLGVLDRESLNLELGVDAQRRTSPLLGRNEQRGARAGHSGLV